MANERSTKQKLIFKNFLLENRDTEMTVSEMSEKLEENGIKIGIATVYRAVKKLEEEGIITKTVGNNGTSAVYRYTGTDMGVRTVHRVFCTSCGRITEIPYKTTDKFEKTVSDLTGYAVADHQIMIYGLCPYCKNHKIKGEFKDGTSN